MKNKDVCVINSFAKASIFIRVLNMGRKTKFSAALSRNFCSNPKQFRQVQKIWIFLDLYKDKAKVVSSLTLCKCWLFCINPKKRKHFCCTSHMMGICQGIWTQVCLRLFFRLMDYQMLVLMLFTVCLNLDYWLEATSHSTVFPMLQKCPKNRSNAIYLQMKEK